jgi:solute carrier family 35 protein F1/2
MILRRYFLGARENSWKQLIGVFICLVGLVLVVVADFLANNNQYEAVNPMLGDGLALIGASFYAITNVGEEFIVIRCNRMVFLSRVGFFGTIYSIIQGFILDEWSKAANLFSSISSETTLEIVGSLSGFVLCMFFFSILVAFYMRIGNSLLFNLSILTADVWSVLCGLYFFHLNLHPLYFFAFAVVVGGVALYHNGSASAPKAATTLDRNVSSNETQI